MREILWLASVIPPPLSWGIAAIALGVFGAYLSQWLTAVHVSRLSRGALCRLVLAGMFIVVGAYVSLPFYYPGLFLRFEETDLLLKQGSRVVALTSEGDTRWSYDTGQIIQFISPLEDLDMDGTREAYVVTEGAEILLVTEDGEIRFNDKFSFFQLGPPPFEVGYSDQFTVRQSIVVDLTGDGIKELIYLANDLSGQVGQIGAIAPTGLVLGTLWHPGALDTIVLPSGPDAPVVGKARMFVAGKYGNTSVIFSFAVANMLGLQCAKPPFPGPWERCVSRSSAELWYRWVYPEQVQILGVNAGIHTTWVPAYGGRGPLNVLALTLRLTDNCVYWLNYFTGDTFGEQFDLLNSCPVDERIRTMYP